MAGWGRMKLEKGHDLQGNEVYICIHPTGNCVVRMKSAFERAGPDVVDYFSSPAENAPSYDPELAELVVKLNALLTETNARRRDRNAKLGILPTPRGFVPIWKYEDPDTAPQLREGSVEPITDETIEGMLWPE